MKRRKALVGILSSMLVLSACSFSNEVEQKNEYTNAISEEVSFEDGEDPVTSDNVNEEIDIYSCRDFITQEDDNFDGIIPHFTEYKDDKTSGGFDGTKWNNRLSTELSLLYVDEECASLFPKLTEALAMSSDKEKEFVEEKNSSFGDGEGFPEHSFYLRIEWLKRADSHYVSLLRESSDYYGQEDDSTYYTGFTYEVQTGRKIQLNEVIPNNTALEKYLAEEVKAVADFYEVELNEDYLECIHTAAEENNLAWTLDEHGVTFTFRPSLIPKDCYVTVPYANILVSEAFLPYSGQEFKSELDMKDGACWNLNIKPTKNIEEFLPVFSADKAENDAYVNVIKKLESTGYMPNGEYCYGSKEQNYAREKEMSYPDSVAVCDVTGDGKSELLITINGAHTSTISQWIFTYNSDKKEFEKLFVNFSTEFFEDGVVKCVFSHGGVYEDDFWPFDLYRYNEQTKEYDFIASVNSDQLHYDQFTGELDDDLNANFLNKEDKDGNGKYYVVGEDCMDDSEYEEWIKKYIGVPINVEWHEIPKFAVID